MQALDQYKRKNGRMFPTCSEILEVIRGMGYAKVPAAAQASSAVPSEVAPSIAEETEDEESLEFMATLA